MKSQIMITLNQIREHKPCADGWFKVLKASGGDKADFDKEFPVSSILDSNNLDDTLWVLRCLPEHESLWQKFAWWTANRVVDNAKDKRVNQCLEVVRSYSDGLATYEELLVVQSVLRPVVRSVVSSMKSPSGISEARSIGRSAALSAVNSALAATIFPARLAACKAASLAARSTGLLEASAVTSLPAKLAACKAASSAARSVQEAKLRNLLDTGKWED